ncbi:MAG: 1-deoxy-D-xylulose-5-phosphate reductoisomerase [Holosporales bacterium]|nr:1-deoxy-D-xylulose-5-phosphate reductoisomerase [Holosporales bacterium]
MKTLSIFGSTGSIGTKMVDFALENLNDFQVLSLTCNSNYKLIIEQAKKLRPKYIGFSGNNNDFKIIKDSLHDIEILPESKICDIAKFDVDIIGMAISGTAGIAPSFASLGHAHRMAIANKETIVSGGNLFMKEAKRLGTNIIPVDSEHNAIFECLQRGRQNSNDDDGDGDFCSDSNNDDFRKITITCSGGPFVDYSIENLEHITAVEQALKHPNWSMGKKNTIDSATLMNKTLEIIEAAYFFSPNDISKIDSIIHRQSIIHGLVYFKDSSVISVMSIPDMRIPINYSFFYPKRYRYNNRLELPETLSFQKFNNWQKENIDIAYDVYKERKCIAFNTANEIAVYKFLNKEIKFSSIVPFVKKCLSITQGEKVNSVSDIIQTTKYCFERFKRIHD